MMYNVAHVYKLVKRKHENEIKIMNQCEHMYVMYSTIQ